MAKKKPINPMDIKIHLRKKQGNNLPPFDLEHFTELIMKAKQYPTAERKKKQKI
ncbi:MAG: hypothetical protein FWH23_06205 [Bacteroidales bacterium]|nr:hypothetical protein [Bacteroidales bacterium]